MTGLHFLAPVYLVICLLLGGASAAGFAANGLLQLMALPIIYWSLVSRRYAPLATPAKWLVGLLIMLLGLFAVQLVPLPPAIWTALPGREPIASGFALLGLEFPWLPVSLQPENSIASLLWLLPAVAILLAILRLGGFRASWLAWALVGTTVSAVAIGATQVAGGQRAATYFYAITNRGAAVGFFSNANHMATLLLAAIPFLAALAASALRKSDKGRRKTASGVLLLIGSAALVFLVGLAINGSLAGLGLAIPTVGASLLILRRSKPLPRWALPVIVLASLASVAAVFTAPLGNNLIGEQAQNAESRQTSFAKTLDAAAAYFPAGSGIGTFQAVYRTQEDPMTISTTFMNHAHSDVLEILLEAGLPGALLMIGLLIWWASRVRAIWRSEELDLFARAATIATGAIIAHSVVDYPLRTAAISVVFAVCLALMSSPRPKARRSDDASSNRHLSAD